MEQNMRPCRKKLSMMKQQTIGYNKKLYHIVDVVPVTNFIKGQTLQWLGYIMGRERKTTIRLALECGNHAEDLGKDGSIYVVEEDFRNMGVDK